MIELGFAYYRLYCKSDIEICPFCIPPIGKSALSDTPLEKLQLVKIDEIDGYRRILKSVDSFRGESNQEIKEIISEIKILIGDEYTRYY